MTIEQDFFKTFGIEPNYWYYTEIGSDRYKLPRINRFLIGKTELIKLLTDNLYRRENFIVAVKVLKVEKNYPPITPEIVLGLENILIDKYKDITISKNQGGWYHYTADINGKGLWEVSGSKNRTEQLLSLSILLKDEISEEVLTLFRK